ncbi:MAG: hypothetical protein AB7O52_19605 [Planctomycetota bacterium]
MKGTIRMKAILMCTLLSLVSSGAWGQKPKDPGFQTAWVRLSEAYEKAEQARYGILFYFPADDEAEHEIFATEEMSIQSRSSPMVKVGKDHAELRTLYEVSPKSPTFVVTDWYGNFMQKWVAAGTADKRIKFEAIRQRIKDALAFADAQEVRLAKGLEKAKKAHAGEKWASALKELAPLAKLAGYKKAIEARDLQEAIVSVAMDQIARIDARPPADSADHIRQLRKIARDFPDPKVEAATNERIAKLE